MRTIKIEVYTLETQMIRRGYEEATGDSAGAIRGCRESIGGRGAI